MNVNKENVAERPRQHRHPLVKVSDDVKIRTIDKHLPFKKRSIINSETEIPFKDWCMPPQPTRYIKANTYDCL
jgi:hypothetical protein